MSRQLAYHEAGHAVAAEVLFPGIVQLATIEPGDAIAARGIVSADARTDFAEPLYGFEAAVVIAASRPAASLSGEEIDERQFNGDDIDVAHLVDSVTRNLARERAFTMISDHAERVTRVGEALYERRTLSGDEIRELL